MQKNWVQGVFTALICALFFTSVMTVGGQAYLFLRRHQAVNAVITEENNVSIWVVDPGHGGEDGGASSADGVIVEKELNLAVAQKMAAIAGLFGHDVRLTRTDDRLLYDAYQDLSDYTGKKKTYDLRNRLRMCEEWEADVFVGIHMNKFPQAQYHGLQVYYSPNAQKSAEYAAFIQSYVKTLLQPENTRMSKQANSSIYLLHRLHCPAVLVECGFLSNPEECAALALPAYQTALSAMLFLSIAECEATWSS